MSTCVVENTSEPIVAGLRADKRASVFHDKLGHSLVANRDVAAGEVLDVIGMHAVTEPGSQVVRHFKDLDEVEAYEHPDGDDFLIRVPVEGGGFHLFDADRDRAGAYINELPLLSDGEKETLRASQPGCTFDYADLLNAELRGPYEAQDGSLATDVVALRDIKKNEEVFACYRKGERRLYPTACEGLSASDALQLSDEEASDGEEVIFLD